MASLKVSDGPTEEDEILWIQESQGLILNVLPLC